MTDPIHPVHGTSERTGRSPDATAAGPPAPLDYAPPPSAGRRWARRLVRWWPAWLLLVLVGLGYVYGPRVWRRYQLLRMQEACLTAELPTDRPVYETDLAAARALIAARPAEYVRHRDGTAVRVDARWAALSSDPYIPIWPRAVPGDPTPTVFCHERFTPAGRRRLVVAEQPLGILVTVAEPAGWTDDGPRLVWRGPVPWDAETVRVLSVAINLRGSLSVGAGVPDPADRSRFTVPFVLCGVAGTFEYRFGDDDRVTARLLDAAGFEARALAARERSATRPAAPGGK